MARKDVSRETVPLPWATLQEWCKVHGWLPLLAETCVELDSREAMATVYLLTPSGRILQATIDGNLVTGMFPRTSWTCP